MTERFNETVWKDIFKLNAQLTFDFFKVKNLLSTCLVSLLLEVQRPFESQIVNIIRVLI